MTDTTVTLTDATGGKLVITPGSGRDAGAVKYAMSFGYAGITAFLSHRSPHELTVLLRGNPYSAASLSTTVSQRVKVDWEAGRGILLFDVTDELGERSCYPFVLGYKEVREWCEALDALYAGAADD